MTPPTGLPGAAFDLGAWSVWWELNQHRFLELKEAIWRGSTTTQDDEFFLGAGSGKAVTRSLRPDEELIARRVLPALRRALERDTMPEVLSGCLTALAKAGADADDETRASCAAALLPFLANPNQQLRETAALSLGLLGGAAQMRTLASLLADGAEGRELSGRRPVAERTRAFAAYGLGVAGQRAGRIDLRRYGVHQLVNALERERGSREVATACVHALGSIELEGRPTARETEDAPLPPAASSEALAAYLLTRLGDEELDERARAHVPRALARSAEHAGEGLTREVLLALLEPLARDRKVPRELEYGAISALGSVGRAQGAELEKAVRRQLDRAFTNGDLLARGFALVALAEASSRPGAPPEGTVEIRERLLEVLAKGRSRERPWAALALGVQGHRLRALGLPLSGEVDLALRAGLEDTGAPKDAAAYAIALGLRGDLASAKAVRARLDQIQEDEARGQMALALGLMRDRSSTERLRELLGEASYRPELIRPVCVALALLDDEGLVPELVSDIEETESSSVRAVLAWALAQVGDARAVEPLIALLEDPEVPDLTRGIAALGLGIACERTPLPWNAELARDVNYPAAPPSLYDPNGGGALNIR